MIISNILGGLGNQMFQYAAGRALSLSNHTELRLDISGFESYKLHHGFLLNRIFSLPAAIASQRDIRKVLGWQASPKPRRILLHPRLSWLRNKGLIVEPHFNFWSGLAAAPSDCYLHGYWQSEKYFADHADTIRADFAFDRPLDERNRQMVKMMRQSNAVSLHVRRGDYASDPRTLSTHGLCPLEYYRAAVKIVADRVASPSFFIFSDDIAWAKENLEISMPCHFIGHNQGAESYRDMQLMSQCRHHIIANSSFSWWGAWLNPDPQKIVIAPRKWFADGKAVEDLMPENWLQI